MLYLMSCYHIYKEHSILFHLQGVCRPSSIPESLRVYLADDRVVGGE